jgi:hypothetical protein
MALLLPHDSLDSLAARLPSPPGAAPPLYARTFGTPLDLARNSLRIGPTRTLTAWGTSLEQLTGLDGFVVRCRRRADRPATAFNVVGELLRQETHGDPVLAAAIEAVRRNNRHLEELADP